MGCTLPVSNVPIFSGYDNHNGGREMIIKKTDLFEGIDVEVMEEIANISSEENYAKDTVIFKQGEKADCLYILAEGTVKLTIKNGGTLIYSL